MVELATLRTRASDSSATSELATRIEKYGEASWCVKDKQVGYHWHEVCGLIAWYNHKVVSRWEITATPDPCRSRAFPVVHCFMNVGCKAKVWGRCYLLELSIIWSVRLSIWLSIFSLRVGFQLFFGYCIWLSFWCRRAVARLKLDMESVSIPSCKRPLRNVRATLGSSARRVKFCWLRNSPRFL